MINPETLDKYDSEKMYKVYEDWPIIALNAFLSERKIRNIEKTNHIIFAGMGGSGAIGDLFEALLSKSPIHVNVIKGYELPKTVNSETLVITISISGNTEETLSILDAANKKHSKIIAFSSGGKMQQYCEKEGINHVKIPLLHSPRASFASYVYRILNELHLVLGIKKEDVVESIDKLKELKKKIGSDNLTKDNPSLCLAQWLVKIPEIYFPFGLKSAAIRFKNSLQENSKKHASIEDVIEFSHNGIVSWERKDNHQAIILQGVDDHFKTKERWKIIEKFFIENNIDFYKITSVTGSILTKLINLIYLLDFATIYKSVIDGIDPTPVSSINYIKKNLQI